jgi:hypothetical protein
MSDTTHATEIPAIPTGREIDARLLACHEEIQALKKLRRASVALEAANQARSKRERQVAAKGVAHAS